MAESEKQEAELLVRMPVSLKDELSRRAACVDDEGASMSKIVRRALREYFRRHPEKS